MDLTASSAVNLPIASASLRLVVVWMGVRSIRCTYSGARVPLRFTLTRNFVLVMVSFPDSGQDGGSQKTLPNLLAALQSDFPPRRCDTCKSDRLSYFQELEKSK